ncbi:hypothetical protein Asulf_00229 [Archaeoglobus sulfaticallidus PM70-1]|uniref:Branched-chain amino acid ABC-type transport system, permease component n=1 Tax=Archaeoglobus sulfaticallidus PM70-1 TaxID=387631 RepID=N0BB81_9EURY|nr:hypothetical protein [Archaeoglobus sulfaticallidus]AGK60263.1 hypothetical protein Asulf_00229 [Archaeoglobus sulfaticallidus PM70-1]
MAIGYELFSSAIFLSIFATCISLNFRISKFLNLALGSVYASGAYISYHLYHLSQTGFGFISSIALSMLAGIVLGVTLYILIKRIGSSMLEATIISLGFGIAVEEILRITHSSGYYLIIEDLNYTIFGIRLWELSEIILFILVFLSLALIYLSKFGIRVKFVEDDPLLAEIYGVDVEKYSLICIALTSSAICVLGAMSSFSLAVSPSIGYLPLMSGIVIASLASIFRSVGIMHYIKIAIISISYSILMMVIW